MRKGWGVTVLVALPVFLLSACGGGGGEAVGPMSLDEIEKWTDEWHTGWTGVAAGIGAILEAMEETEEEGVLSKGTVADVQRALYRLGRTLEGRARKTRTVKVNLSVDFGVDGHTWQFVDEESGEQFTVTAKNSARMSATIGDENLDLAINFSPNGLPFTVQVTQANEESHRFEARLGGTVSASITSREEGEIQTRTTYNLRVVIEADEFKRTTTVHGWIETTDLDADGHPDLVELNIRESVNGDVARFYTVEGNPIQFGPINEERGPIGGVLYIKSGGKLAEIRFGEAEEGKKGAVWTGEQVVATYDPLSGEVVAVE